MADGTAQAQLRVIHRVVDALSAVGVPAWLFGGWGLDARIGRITRGHGDVEFWVRRSGAARSRTALADAGSTALPTQPPEESCEFRVTAMSVAGMLAMKEQFPALRNGRPWRDKDVSDIAVLRGLLRSGSC
jgi:Aminoglycoside-2''-adenylyltransferase